MLMFRLSDAYVNQLWMYNLLWLKTKIVPTTRTLPRSYVTVGDLENVTTFQIGQSTAVSLLLLI